MDHIWESGAVSTAPLLPATPSSGYPAEGTSPTIPGAYWFYQITEEIRNAIIAAGIVPSANSVNQLAQAISIIGGQGSPGARYAINVLNFGADPTGVNDSTSAIQSAITYAGSNAYGGLVYIPSGIYVVSSSLVISSNYVSISGASRDSVQLVRTSAYGETFVFTKNTATVLDGVGISNLRIIDNGTNNASGTAVRVENVSRFSMSDVTLLGGTSGIVLKGAANVNISNVSMYMQNSSGASSGRYGIQLTHTAIPSAAVVFGSNIQLDNINIFGGDQYTGTYSNLDDCIRIECVDGLWLNNIYAGGAAIADLHIYSTSTTYTCGDIFCSNSMFDICRGNGIRIDGTQYSNKVDINTNVSCGGVGTSSQDGIYINAPVDSIRFSGGVFGWNGNGIHIANTGGTAATNIVIVGMNITENNEYGIQLEANVGTNFIQIKSNNLSDNVLGAINDLTSNTSTTKDLEGNLPYHSPWVSYTPTVAAAGGTVIGTATGYYRKISNVVNFQAKLTAITSDTGTGYLILGLPSNAGAVAGDTYPVIANETTTNVSCTARVTLGSTTCFILKYDGSYPSAVGKTIVVSGTYEVA